MENMFAGPLAAFAPVEIRLVGSSDGEPLWDELVRRHHYLGYRRLLGHRLKYLAFIRDQPVAALSFSGAALMVQVRDRFIGWNPQQRRAHLKSIANNSRFLILPWVRIPHLASHLLGRCVRRARHDWPQRSGHPLWLVETFVDPERYRGTSYRAANWQYLGESSGYSKEGISYRHHGERKEIYLQVLEPRFRRLIGCVPLPSCRPSRMTTVEERAMITRHVNWDPHLMPAMDLEPHDLGAVAEELRTFHKQFQPEGMICLDSSEFAKKGQESVGVARQYCGELGKLENCQSGVFVGYSGRKGYGLLAGRLYMPESWFAEDQRQRREDNLVPENLAFATKPQIARALIDQDPRRSLSRALGRLRRHLRCRSGVSQWLARGAVLPGANPRQHPGLSSPSPRWHSTVSGARCATDQGARALAANACD